MHFIGNYGRHGFGPDRDAVAAEAEAEQLARGGGVVVRKHADDTGGCYYWFSTLDEARAYLTTLATEPDRDGFVGRRVHDDRVDLTRGLGCVDAYACIEDMREYRVTVAARKYKDCDDCLAAAAADYVASHPDLAGWDLSPEWRDDLRDEIVLTVPRRGWAR